MRLVVALALALCLVVVAVDAAFVQPRAHRQAPGPAMMKAVKRGPLNIGTNEQRQRDALNAAAAGSIRANPNGAAFAAASGAAAAGASGGPAGATHAANSANSANPADAAAAARLRHDQLRRAKLIRNQERREQMARRNVSPLTAPHPLHSNIPLSELNQPHFRNRNRGRAGRPNAKTEEIVKNMDQSPFKRRAAKVHGREEMERKARVEQDKLKPQRRVRTRPSLHTLTRNGVFPAHEPSEDQKARNAAVLAERDRIREHEVKERRYRAKRYAESRQKEAEKESAVARAIAGAGALPLATAPRVRASRERREAKKEAALKASAAAAAARGLVLEQHPSNKKKDHRRGSGPAPRRKMSAKHGNGAFGGNKRGRQGRMHMREQIRGSLPGGAGAGAARAGSFTHKRALNDIPRHRRPSPEQRQMDRRSLRLQKTVSSLNQMRDHVRMSRKARKSSMPSSAKHIRSSSQAHHHVSPSSNSPTVYFVLIPPQRSLEGVNKIMDGWRSQLGTEDVQLTPASFNKVVVAVGPLADHSAVLAKLRTFPDVKTVEERSHVGSGNARRSKKGMVKRRLAAQGH